MIFSSTTFLFLFLPVVLAGSLLVGRRWQNAFLFLASLLFYAWGEVVWAWVIGVSIGCNYALGRWLERTGRRRALISFAIVFNLGLLGVFKYAGFVVANWNVAARCLGLPALGVPRVHLPIGISFYTFHALSYLIDVYRRQVRAQRNLVDFGLYITMFPQLIAGPIIRYHDIADQLGLHRVDVGGLAEGVRRFIVGLGKKVLIANTLAGTADAAFAFGPGTLSPAMAWLGIVAYALQIYYDFSAYSDMAIGLGRMFGLRFLENFNYPYVSQSVTEFWRRWHISLSNWFRDYLYIPLGGSRGGRTRTYFNLYMVFFLCGLWHGASWNFVVWGLYHGSLLVLERIALGPVLARLPRLARHAYTVVAVMVGWVFFRAETLRGALDYLAVMVGAKGGPGSLGEVLQADVVMALLVGCAGAAPILPALSVIRERLALRPGTTAAVLVSAWECAALMALALLFVASAALLAAGTYNPFIYFRF